MLAFSCEDAHFGALPSLPEWTLDALHSPYIVQHHPDTQVVDVDKGSGTKAHPGKGKAHASLPEVQMEHGQR